MIINFTKFGTKNFLEIIFFSHFYDFLNMQVCKYGNVHCPPYLKGPNASVQFFKPFYHYIAIGKLDPFSKRLNNEM